MISGRTSAGRSRAFRGASSSALRAAICARSRATGASERLTTHHAMTASSGVIGSIGRMVRSASVRAISRRASMSCATITSRPGALTE